MKLEDIIKNTESVIEEDSVDKLLSRSVKAPSASSKKSKKIQLYDAIKKASKKSKKKWIKLEDLTKDSGLPYWKLHAAANDYQKHNFKFRRLSFETIKGKLHISILR